MSNKVAILEKRLIALYRATENINVQIDKLCDQIEDAEEEERVRDHPKACRERVCWCKTTRQRRTIEV